MFLDQAAPSVKKFLWRPSQILWDPRKHGSEGRAVRSTTVSGNAAGWVRRAVACALAGGLAASAPGAETPSPTARFDGAVAAAEASLRKGDREGARASYARVLEEGWLLLGTIDRLDGRLAEARAAFEDAAVGGGRPARKLIRPINLSVGLMP